MIYRCGGLPVLLATTLTACATPGAPGAGSMLFHGGERSQWGIVVQQQTVTLHEGVGRNRWTYYGHTPIAQAIVGGIRYDGTVTRTDVVAGEAVDSDLEYVLDIEARPCGSKLQATLTLRIEVDDGTTFDRTGCGTAGAVTTS
ncbi:hypothetical protein [Sphingomonas sp.]|uniref:hypothetical protein n=1 Tax=Sphingomonas sp. TaxID=28214 RepID=UPI0035BC4230